MFFRLEVYNPENKFRALKESFGDQVEKLEKVGITKAGKITGIDGKKYSVPTKTELEKKLKENKRIIEKKKKEGFNKLVLVPFGMELGKLIDVFGQKIIDNYKGDGGIAEFEVEMDVRLMAHFGKDFIEKYKDTKRELIKRFRAALKKKGKEDHESRKEPIYISTDYIDADTQTEKDGGLIYFPDVLNSLNFQREIIHGGKTKTEIIKEEGAWQIWLVNDEQNNIKSPDEAIEKMGKNEFGIIPELALTRAIMLMHEKGEFIEDTQCCGAFFPRSSCGVPWLKWSRSGRQFFLTVNSNPSFNNRTSNSKTGVRLI